MNSNNEFDDTYFWQLILFEFIPYLVSQICISDLPWKHQQTTRWSFFTRLWYRHYQKQPKNYFEKKLFYELMSLTAPFHRKFSVPMYEHYSLHSFVRCNGKLLRPGRLYGSTEILFKLRCFSRLLLLVSWCHGGFSDAMLDIIFIFPIWFHNFFIGSLQNE